MQVIVVKDGTVPVAVAKVIASDGNIPDDGYEYVQAFEVPDDATALYVTWAEDAGFDCYAFADLNSAFIRLNEGASDDAIAASNIDGRHWAITYEPGDHESYGHLFILS